MGFNRRMRPIIALFVMGVLTACGHNPELNELRQAVPRGTAFQNELAKLYLTYAEVEQQYGNYNSSSFFAEKGLKAAYGNDLDPEKVKDWPVTDAQRKKYVKQRKRLLETLSDEVKKDAPQASAGAVFYYDCMLVKHTKEPNGEEYVYCKEQWQAMMADLREAQTDMVARQSFEEHDAAELKSADRFLVYFALDDFSLSDAAERTVELLYQELNRKTGITIVVNGHTDTSGPDRYNMVLSNKRAETVKKMLVSLGMQPEDIATFGFGETDLVVPTLDGVVEQQNRRVEIVVN